MATITKRRKAKKPDFRNKIEEIAYDELTKAGYHVVSNGHKNSWSYRRTGRNWAVIKDGVEICCIMGHDTELTMYGNTDREPSAILNPSDPELVKKLLKFVRLRTTRRVNWVKRNNITDPAILRPLMSASMDGSTKKRTYTSMTMYWHLRDDE